MTIIRYWLEQATQILMEAGLEQPKREAQYLLQRCLKCEASDVILDREKNLSKVELSRLQVWLMKRAKHMPLAYIAGSIDFYRFHFFTPHHVLIPRSDSEVFLEAVHELFIDQTASFRILETASGTGALGLSVLADYPNATATLSDVSALATATIAHNADQLALRGRVEIITSDWLKTIVAHPFDLVLINPPYIASGDIALLPPNIRDFEPHLALDGGKDGLDCYRLLNQQLFVFVGNYLLLEIGIGMRDAVVGVMQNFTYQKSWVDLGGVERVLLLRRK